MFEHQSTRLLRVSGDYHQHNFWNALMLNTLQESGYQVEVLSHARAILDVDFPQVEEELTAVLKDFKIPVKELIAGGGGEAKGTQRLRNALADKSWPKFHFHVERKINGKVLESQSHEVDHVREMEAGRVALEIEWNNKDPFFDRDLENYKRLHADGAISVGIIITRGTSLHENMREIVGRFLDDNDIGSLDDLTQWGYEPTSRQKSAIRTLIDRKKDPLSFRDAFCRKFVADKFGEATTHWRKLEDRIHRGVGNPCPLLLIGLPDSIVDFS
ncbi:BglII/BstYI family type II restriction endonuclease [uncultured Pelagimonas sp.]|uniref:BglII/BstYI family type II restriction endonuclease n=1 Tax=uncultured Pelagimonas sp. TaxID=1618102 RepID=UPI0026110227|nr:BglII/BstYI family type II restriction endonuclease [uncultured Pelagimonas sp.]